MTEAIIVALITGGLSLLGSAIAVWAASRKQAEEFRVQQAVMTEQINSLTREVREHNGFAKTIPEIKGDVKVIQEQVKVMNHRISDLEDDTK